MTSTPLAIEKLWGVSDAPELDVKWIEEDASDERDFWRMINERATGKPLAYVLGEWEFYGRRFFVDENVLVPRPDTEDLVDKALEYLHTSMCGRDVLVADIGTGSGCIIISLVLELMKSKDQISNFKFVATDISSAALKVAKKNAKGHGVLDKIEFLEGDMLEPLCSLPLGRYATTPPRAGGENILIVSNPPYVPTEEAKENRFEPQMALDGGMDGKRFTDQIKASGITAIMEVTGGAVETA